MSECGDTSSAAPCCGGSCSSDDYVYGPQAYERGEVDTFLGPVPRVTAELTTADRLGALRMRTNVGRNDYRVRPGIYALGAPDDTSPVLVSANYKLSFDALRRELSGRDAWLLVLDTRGVNVWCSAGKKLFSTAELVRRIGEVHLEQLVSHQRLVLPQLGATGVSAHEVRRLSGFRVTYGPVRAADLPAFLDAGFKATPEMRRVRFGMAERAKLVGVELSLLWRPAVLGGAAIALIATGAWRPLLEGRFLSSGAGLGMTALLAAVLAGAAIVPLLLPWLPGRAFSLKGAVAGALVAGGIVLALAPGVLGPVRAVGLVLAATALASYTAMNFTGSSTFTSPSGVEWEMRRALPLQVAGGVLGVGAWLAALFLGRGV